MTSKGLWPFFMKMCFLTIGQVEKLGEKKPSGKHGNHGFLNMEIFGLWKKKPLLMKRSKKFFTAGYLNGPHLKAGAKENLKNEGESM